MTDATLPLQMLSWLKTGLLGQVHPLRPDYRRCLAALGTQLLRLKQQIVEFDRMIMAWHRSTRRASAFITFPGSVRCWRPPWSRVLLTPETSDQDVTSRPGLGSFRSSARVGARTGSAASANRPSSLIVRMNRGGPVALKHQSESDFRIPREILLTVQSDSRSVRAGAHNSRDGNQHSREIGGVPNA